MTVSIYRVHKPEVPRGPASTPGLSPNRQHTTHGPTQESKTTGRKGGPVTDRKVWTKRNGARSSTTLAHLSDRSACFRLQPPSDSLSDRKAWPKALLPTPTPHRRPGGTETLLTALLRLARSEPTGAIRPGTLARKEPGANGESKLGRISQTMISGTIPCTPAGTVLCNRPNTNSIVGADIYLYSVVGAVNSHMLRPPRASGHR